MRRAAFFAGVFATTLLVSSRAPAAGPAAGMTKDQCIDANTQAQSLRRDGKFAEARAQIIRCADPACPDVLREDCAQRMDELEKAQPTIIFDAKDGDGHDLFAVQVTADGQPLADKLEGKALRVDPGEHSFTFTVAGQPPLTQTFVLKEGEKDRRERIVIGAPTAAPAPAPGAPAPGAAPGEAPSATPETPPHTGLGTRRILGIGVGAFGLGGVGVGAVFGLLASSAWSSAKSACGGDTSRCANVSSAESYKSTTNTDGMISNIGFIAGGVLLATGVVLFVTGKPHESAPAATVSVAPSVGPGQGGIAVGGSF